MNRCASCGNPTTIEGFIADWRQAQHDLAERLRAEARLASSLSPEGHASELLEAAADCLESEALNAEECGDNDERGSGVRCFTCATSRPLCAA